MLYARYEILHRPTNPPRADPSGALPRIAVHDLEGCQGGCMYLPDKIAEQPWARVPAKPGGGTAEDGRRARSVQDGAGYEFAAKDGMPGL